MSTISLKELKNDINTIDQAVNSQQQFLDNITYSKLVNFPFVETALTDGQTDFDIPLASFNNETDTILVSQNTSFLHKNMYSIVEETNKLRLTTGVKAGTEIGMIIFKSIPTATNNILDGHMFAENSIPQDRLENGADFVKIEDMSVIESVEIEDQIHPLVQTELDNINAELTQKATKNIATTSIDGLMSSTDKTKLNNIENNANNYVHPTTAGNKHIPSGGTTGQTLVYGGSSGTVAWGSATNGLKSVQRGVITFTNTSSIIDVSISAVSSISKCVVSLPNLIYQATSNGVADFGVGATLTSTTNLRISGSYYIGEGYSAKNIYWQVAEFY